MERDVVLFHMMPQLGVVNPGMAHTGRIYRTGAMPFGQDDVGPLQAALSDLGFLVDWRIIMGTEELDILYTLPGYEGYAVTPEVGPFAGVASGTTFDVVVAGKLHRLVLEAVRRTLSRSLRGSGIKLDMRSPLLVRG